MQSQGVICGSAIVMRMWLSAREKGGQRERERERKRERETDRGDKCTSYNANANANGNIDWAMTQRTERMNEQ